MSIDLIRERFQQAGVKLEKDDFWSVQGTPVIKHRALEKLGAAVGIKWAVPQVLRAERDEAVILVSGTKGENTEWSIGEAVVNANYRVTGKMAPYVYAMAEKRGKDRVIIKLAGLHGVYSEEEADDLREPTRQQSNDQSSDSARFVCIAALRMAETVEELTAWGELNADNIKKLTKADQDAVRDAFKSHMNALKAQTKEAA